MAELDDKVAALETQLTALTTQQTEILTALGALAGPIQEATRGTRLDALLGGLPGTPAAKTAVRQQLLPGTAEITEAGVREALATQRTQAAAILGSASPVRGMGATGEPVTEAADTTEALTRVFEAAGLHGKALEIAVSGRAR